MESESSAVHVSGDTLAALAATQKALKGIAANVEAMNEQLEAALQVAASETSQLAATLSALERQPLPPVPRFTRSKPREPKSSGESVSERDTASESDSL